MQMITDELATERNTTVSYSIEIEKISETNERISGKNN